MRRIGLGCEPCGPPSDDDIASLRAGLWIVRGCGPLLQGISAWIARGRPLYVCQVDVDLERMVELGADRATLAAYLEVIDFKPARVHRVRERLIRPIEDVERGKTVWAHLAVLRVLFRRPMGRLPLEVALHGAPIVIEAWFDADNKLIAYAFGRGLLSRR
ncbi:MAG: hypothetical protein NW217_15545 [Hyphomicrobiaceae bacterium]|nr:hypothetical protein [Hyphomicrobiaceae bacterium]